MNASFDGLPERTRWFRSIFDTTPADSTLSLDDLESLIQADTERRILVVLDRILAAHHNPPAESTEPE